MKAYVIIAGLALAGGLYVHAQEPRAPRQCKIIHDEADAREHALKYLEKHPEIWRKYFSDATDMRRSASYERRGRVEFDEGSKLFGIEDTWSYRLDLQCQKSGAARVCDFYTYTFDECGQDG